jgi:beta-xylosidase
VFRRTTALVAAAVAASVLIIGSPAIATASSQNQANTRQIGQFARATYTNPVSQNFADTFADPTVVRGNDGYWYAYATADPLKPGGQRELIPTAKSADLVNWSFVGDALDQATRPAYVSPDSTYFAPDVRYLNGRYVMYYVATDTTTSDRTDDSAIGVATAPGPTGPWTQADEPLIAPRPAPGGGYLATIDPAELTASDGTRYLYYGSYFGGLFVTQLTPDGLHAVGSPTQVAIDNKYEGSFVVHHDGYYYLFASSSNCCAGPTTGYAVSVGRATSPLGPFVDANGVSLLASHVGGTPVVTQNGNRWVGPGHNGVVTDLSGQDYLVYHAIDHNTPYLDQVGGVNRRPMLIDRLDWVDGWPVVRAGAGPSDTPQPAPVTEAAAHEGQQVSGDVRVEADLRAASGGSAAVVVGDIRASIDTDAGKLVVSDRHGRRAAASLPGYLDYTTWHNLAVEVRGGAVSASLTEARESGPIVSVRLAVPSGEANGRIGTVAGRGGASANLSAARLFTPVTQTVPAPRTGRLVASDEFNGTALSPAWTWVRPDANATVSGGSLNWPVPDGDLAGTSNNVGVLLRDAPRGDYTVETKLTLPLGDTAVRNYQQAGLVAYLNDDDYASLHTVAIWNTRQIEFARELSYQGQLQFGGVTVGMTADTVWLRLIKRTSAATGELTFRGASSVDGVHWTLGGTWTFPRGSQPRIGLVALGGSSPAVTAQFDYFRVFAP